MILIQKVVLMRLCAKQDLKVSLSSREISQEVTRAIFWRDAMLISILVVRSYWYLRNTIQVSTTQNIF